MKLAHSLRLRLTRNRCTAFAAVIVGISSVIAIVAAQSAAIAASKGTVRDGWELVQKAEEGDYNVSVTSDAVRAYCVRHKYSVIATAPKWDVYAVDTNKKIYAKVPWSKFETQGLLDFFQPIPLPTQKERKLEKIDYDGIPATVIKGKYPQNDPNIKAEAVTNRFMLGKDPKKAPPLESFTYTVTDRMGTSKYVNAVLRIMYGLPVIDEFPLAYSHRKSDGKKSNVLTTKRIAKAKIATDTFNVDLKFKLVKRPLDVVYKARSQEMNDIFDSLGVGTEFGSGNTKKK